MAGEGATLRDIVRVVSREVHGRQFVIGPDVEGDVTVSGEYEGDNLREWLEGVASAYGYRVRDHGDLTIIEAPGSADESAVAGTLESVSVRASQSVQKVGSEIMGDRGSVQRSEDTGIMTVTGPVDLVREVVSLRDAWADRTGGDDASALVDLDYASADEAVKALEALEWPIDAQAVTGQRVALRGLSAYVDRARSWLSEYDQDRPAIGVRVVVVESTITAAYRLGLAWGTQSGDAAGGVAASGPLSATGPVDLLSDTAGGALAWASPDAGISLDALRADSDVDVLSEPHVRVLSGESARVHVGQQVPVRGEREITDDGREIQDIERQDVGVIVEMQPRTYGDQVRSSVDVDVSQVRDAVDDELGVVIGQRQIRTSITAGYCETVTLGGLIRERDQESVDAVPVLGSVPVLGTLFRSQDTSTETTYLAVVLRFEPASGACERRSAARARAADLVEDAAGDTASRPGSPGPGCALMR